MADLATKSDFWLGDQERLTEPMILRPGATHYEPVSWAEAFGVIANELRALSSPNEAVFYTSGRTSNETAFLYQLFVRAYGTNNLPDGSNMCHESTSAALPPMIGIGKGCVKLADFDQAEAIFVMGQNPGTNHPRMLTALQRAKETEERVSRPTRREIRLRAAAPIRVRRGRGDQGDARQPRQSFLRHGRQLRFRDVRHRIYRRWFKEMQFDSPRINQTEPRPCRHRPDRVDSAVPGPDRSRSSGASGEQFQTRGDSMGIVNPTRGNLSPPSPNLLSEVAIVTGLAKAVLGATKPVEWDAYAANYDLIRDKIAEVIPGFANYNQRIRQGIFYLPNGPRDERKFATPSGKAVFIPHPLSRATAGPGQYLLTTLRSQDQFNTSIYGLDDRYRGIFNGRRVLFMNETDIREAGLVQGQLVDLTSHYQGQTREAAAFMLAPYPIPRGCRATYFPEGNVLVPIDSVADTSNTPTSNPWSSPSPSRRIKRSTIGRVSATHRGVHNRREC